MKKFVILMMFFIAYNSFYAQDKKYLDKDKEPPLSKTASIEDRAAGVHNASNIGLYFENRGKLYPRRNSLGPCGEYPINSGKNYIYRVNPYVAIPRNCIQGRYTTNEEWEAVGGYNNPDYALIAFSDNTKTWPSTGWPVKDAQGNPIIKSDQDSYCVYNDAMNTRKVTGIQVAQTGYAYGVKFAGNILFYKFDVTNTSSARIDSVYMALYCDVDVGDLSGGVAEYADDLTGYDKDKNFLYFYDSKGYSSEWTDKKTGYFGFSFLKTPEINGKEAGVTDMHYFLYEDDDAIDIDSIEFARIASSRWLYNSDLKDKFFHVSNSQNLHYDDPALQPAAGHDVAAIIASGPYNLEPGQTITFYTAMIAGDNLAEATSYYTTAKKIVDYDFEISKPPATPTLTGIAGDGSVTLYWNDIAEKSKDNFSGQYDFEGYRLYRSQDKGVNWTLLADYDVSNTVGMNTGLQYSYVDSKVTNGFEYWYSITAYDRGDSTTSSLESAKGTSTSAINLAAVTPVSKAAGYNAVSGGTVSKVGNGKSNYVLNVAPVDDNSLKDNTYKVGFTYTARKDKGKFSTNVKISISDSSKTVMNNYGLEWMGTKKLRLLNMATGDEIGNNPKTYFSGVKYNLNAGLIIELNDATTDVQYLPKSGDFLSVNFSAYVIRNGKDTVMYPHQFELGKPNSTTDGVVFTLAKPDVVKDVSRIGGKDAVEITFSVADETAVEDNVFIVSTNGKGTNKNGEGFISVLVRDQSQNTIASFDTLYNSGTFGFKGIQGTVAFTSSAPPSAGNIFSVTTQKPVKPNVQDYYAFGINGSSVNNEQMKQQSSDIKVVPNPYLVSSLYEPEYGELRREPLRQIQFINLPTECTISIFTVDADLVKTIHHSAMNGTEAWNLRSEGGREVAPGIYIYVVQAEGVEFKSRFAIIK